MTYYYPMGGVPLAKKESIMQTVYAQKAAEAGVSYEEYAAAAAAKAAERAALPQCFSNGLFSTMLPTKQNLCSEGVSYTIDKNAIKFGGRDTTVAAECLRAGLVGEAVVECNKANPKTMSNLKNLGDPFQEYAYQTQLPAVILAAGVPESLVKTVADEYKKRVKMLNSSGGTKSGITKKLSTQFTALATALLVLKWYNQPFEKRLGDVALKYKAKIQQVTAAEAAQAANEEMLDEAIASEGRKKVLLYGAAGIVAIGIGFLLT